MKNAAQLRCPEAKPVSQALHAACVPRVLLLLLMLHPDNDIRKEDSQIDNVWMTTSPKTEDEVKNEEDLTCIVDDYQGSRSGRINLGRQPE